MNYGVAEIRELNQLRIRSEKELSTKKMITSQVMTIQYAQRISEVMYNVMDLRMKNTYKDDKQKYSKRAQEAYNIMGSL